MATTMRPGDRIPMSWAEYDAVGEFWGEYVDGHLIAGPMRTGTHQDIVRIMTTTLHDQIPSPLHAIHQWGWKVGSDEFIPDVMVFDESKAQAEDVRLLTTPLLVVEVLSTESARDFLRKFAKYAAAGLERYWIIDPGEPGEQNEGDVLEVIEHSLVGDVLVGRARHRPGATVTLEIATDVSVSFDPAILLD